MGEFTIICASNDDEMLNQCLLRSPCIARGAYECIVQKGFANVPAAYNQAVRHAGTDLLCFVHQDVFLPEGWDEAFLRQVERVERMDPSWALVGCAGTLVCDQVKQWAGHIDDRGIPFGAAEGLPVQVESLDELLIACRRADAEFDEGMPNYHLFATELCLRRRREGRRVYAIDAFCHHNSRLRRDGIPGPFALGCGYLYAKYPDMLPIVATSVTIQRIDGVCVLSL